jgi:UDP-glucuronate 4-epimerase
LHYVDLSEKTIGRRAEKEFAPVQPGDVKETFAVIEAIRRGHGFKPKIRINEGTPHFIAW